MKEDRITKAFEKLNPRLDQKEKVWERIEAMEDRKNIKEKNVWKVAAAVILTVVITTVVVNRFTDGAVIAAIRQVCGRDKKSEEIVGKVKDARIATKSVYAPEVCEITKERLIFGTDSGLVIYDRTENRVQATVDLQEIDCIYFDGDQKQTHIYVEENKLYVFNTENRKPFGIAYCYNLKQDQMNLQISAQITDKEDIKQYYKKWKKRYREYSKNTYENLMDDSGDLEKKLKAGMQITSENAYLWLDNNKAQKLSCLVVSNEGKYSLFTRDMDTGVISEEGLNIVSENLENTTSSSTGDLTKFVYDGKDEILRAIMNDAYKKIVQWDGAENGEILIPAPTIVETITAGKETLVFGWFWYYGYYKNGDILESMSGGESNAACIHLEKQGDGYKVTKVERTGDGGMRRDDLIRITKKYTGLYDKMMDVYMDDNRLKKTREKWIRYYVKKNHVNVRYYKDSGWDPVEIFHSDKK